MRLIHTSDWHLGHTLHDLSRRAEHLAFFDWLLDRLESLAADALLVAGDVFDTANPSAEAQADFYEFLARARARLPKLDLVVIGGNHDSASRLDAPEPVLRAHGVKVVGGLPRRSDGSLDADRLLCPLTDAAGKVAAQVIAVPFLRPADLPTVPEAEGDPLVEGVRRLYAEAVAAAEKRRAPGQALIAMGHLYLVGTQLSERSERKILGGNQHALPHDLFPESLSYVALGHLHLPQKVGRDSIRYSGSPIPLSFSEISYPHQICIVDFEGEQLRELRTERIPRSVELLQLPADGPKPLDEVLPLLAALKAPASVPVERRPILEVQVRLPQPEPTLRASIEKALEGKGVRLARIATEYAGTGQSLADAAPRKALRDLNPEEVFRLRWAREHEGEPPQELLAAFRELIEDAHASEEAA